MIGGASVPMPIQQAMQQAAMAYGRGDLAEAESLCRHILAARGDYLDALNLLGIIAARTRRLDEAARLFGSVVQINPLQADAHNNFGNVLKDLKHFQAALDSYERALKIRPDFAEALNNRGNALQELKRFDEALASYGQALALRPDYAEAFNNRGHALKELQRFDEALASYDHALALGRNYPGTFHSRGDVLQGLKRFDEAVASYDRALALRPDFAEVLNNRGNALSAMRRFDEAVASFDRALALRPDYAEALYNRGNVLQELKRPDEALASYNQALALNAAVLGDFRAFDTLGSLFYELGRRDQAVDVYRRWLEAEPANAIAQHMYAAVSRDNVPQRASAQYVTTYFDRFADSFNMTLERVDYAAPQLLYEALVQTVDCNRGDLVVLDAGCGTGLCGVPLRPSAKVLAGVDLSSQMLARARALNLYDELFEGELCQFMASRPEEFDMVICADTLIYFGALEEAVMAARRCLRPNGVFAFTVEALLEESSAPFTINAHGRYAHAAEYVCGALESSGFSAIECKSVVLRKEFGTDVKGYLFTSRV